VATKRDHPRKRAEPGGASAVLGAGWLCIGKITQFFTDPAHKQFTEGSDTRNAVSVLPSFVKRSTRP
jgi:hypothetical protein